MLAALAGILALGYLAARETSLFRLAAVRVAGPSPEVQDEVRAALRDLEGTSLVKVDARAVERRLEALPSVVSASVDRAFPDALAIVVVPERPLAVIRYRTEAWIVSERGRVIRGGELKHLPDLPRIWLASAASLTPAAFLRDPRGTAALSALAHLPERFTLPVLAARSADEKITLVLGGEVELRLGRLEDVPVKLAAARAVLDSLPREERRALEYLDVSLPERPVAMEKSQPVG